MIPLEDIDSWTGFTERRRLSQQYGEEGKDFHPFSIEGGKEEEIIENRHRLLKHHQNQDAKKRKKKLEKLRSDPGIQVDTMHGMIIDAGSTGSRMHVYEFDKRILEGEKEISAAVSGRKLTYPGTDSRWTERLSPGIATFSTKSDEELLPAIADYLKPLIEFAEAVLWTKQQEWSQFPVYLKATAGMRMLETKDRLRVMKAVRDIFNNSTHSKFRFETEYARVISGEEEAIYGWAGANFVLGSLLKSSEGSGTVMNPKLTHGALDMGGASTQISFYQDNMDIMSNLFKLQIGQGKHWNVYAHSHLCFGVNEAWNRMGAYLSTENKTIDPDGSEVYNPCLPGESESDFQSTIIFHGGKEIWKVDSNGNPFSYNTTMTNQNRTGDYDACSGIAYSILNKQYNAWCEFSHHGDCSFSGVYQPQLPTQSQNFGEFLAFSNYYHIWAFLKLPLRSSLTALQDGARKVCSMNVQELKEWNGGQIPEEESTKMCFRASYAFQVLRNGYGFKMEDNITATNVVAGQKVGWALGSMLYEINTLPWKYIPHNEIHEYHDIVGQHKSISGFLGGVIICIMIGFYLIFRSRRNRRVLYQPLKTQYSSVDEVELER